MTSLDALFRPPPPTVWAGQFGVFFFIACCTLLGALIPAVRRSPSTRAAIHSWWPVSIVATIGNSGGTGSALAVFGLVSAVVVDEGLRLLRLPDAIAGPTRVLGALTAVLAHAALLWRGDGAVVVVGVTAFVVVPVLQLVVVGPEDFIRRCGGVQWILVAGIGLWSFGPRLYVDANVAGPHGAQGAAFVFFVLVMMADAMAYVGGKVFGRTPLIPRVSPKKTVEGLVFSAVVVAVVGAGIGSPMMGLSWWVGALVGMGVVVVGLAGDLIVSGWKRDAGIKDSGSLLPGQGGLLDRCDSILFVAPWFWLFATWIGHAP